MKQENKYDDLSDMTMKEKEIIKHWTQKGRFNLNLFRSIKSERDQINKDPAVNHQETFVK